MAATAITVTSNDRLQLPVNRVFVQQFVQIDSKET